MTIVLAGIIRYSIPDLRQLCDLAINLASFILFSRIAVIIHEAGHLFFGWSVGGNPKRLIFGTGQEVYRTQINEVKIIVKTVPVGGMAICYFPDLPSMQYRYAFYAFGGVLANCLVAGLFYLIFGFNLRFVFAENGIDVTSSVIFANSLLVLNLLPYHTSRYGFKLPTDGLLIIQSLRGSYNEHFKYLKYNEDYYRAYELFEQRDYEEALKAYKAMHDLTPEAATPLFMMATTDMKLGRVADAIPVLLELEKKNSPELSSQKGFLWNNLAWAYLLNNETDLAYNYSSLAIKALPKNETVNGTHGAVLVEKGNFELGKQWLSHTVSFENSNNETLTTSIFMALGYHLNGNKKEEARHFEYVLKNENKLDMDSLIVWNRFLRRVNANEQVMK